MIGVLSFFFLIETLNHWSKLKLIEIEDYSIVLCLIEYRIKNTIKMSSISNNVSFFNMNNPKKTFNMSQTTPHIIIK